MTSYEEVPLTMKSVVYVLLILCLTLCDCAHAAPDSTAEPRIFCDTSHINSAWGYQQRGVYVDPEGNVYSYGGDKVWSPKQPESPTEQELEEQYSQGRKPIGKVDAQELHEKYRLVEPASRGQLSKPIQHGADQGESVSRCYMFDAAAGRYREVELKVTGDVSYENLAPSARELTKWLESIAASKDK